MSGDSTPPDDTELDGCELGTIEYWESSYVKESANYRSHGNVGEVWFDEDSQFRVIKWMETRDLKNKSIVDLGCGNGMMLIELKNEGFNNLTGIDYSPNGIELAKSIAKDRNFPDIVYKVGDILSAQFVADFGQFDVIHDKGTYDAISLHPDNPKEKREQYIENVHQMLPDEDALLIITSCNWTQSELVESFRGHFVMFAVIPTPSFMFGGKVGHVVSSLVFKKVAK